MSAPGAPKKSRHSHSTASAPAQVNIDENIEPVNVFCVEPSEACITSDEVEYFRETFAIMNDYGVGGVWMSEEKALKVSASDESFYFLAAFRGRVFEHLKKIRVNLYGVHAVRQTLTTGGSLPRWDFPVYSLNLTGVCVCFTGLSLERREELKDKINYMNGIVSPALTEKVTHLVTERCDSTSKKYTEARRMCLPIMSPKWIEKAWDCAQRFSIENFSAKESVMQHRLPIFNQMIITATGIGGNERIDIARLVELNGGRFSGDMKRNECTHLIADHTKGTKYKKAREWGTIKIVRESWLRKSVEAGYVLPESAFDPGKRNRCSTPVLTSRAPEPLEDLDYSVIHGKGGRLDSSAFNTQFSKHNEEPEPEPERTPLSFVRTSIRRECSRLRLASSTPTVFDPIDHLGDTYLKGDFDFLEGCRIWLCGVDQSRVDKWKKLLDRSGATRVGTMEAASHIIVLNASAPERSKLTYAKSRGVQVVRAEWVLACCKAKDLIGAEEYLWDPEDTVLRTASTFPSHASDFVETPRRFDKETSSRPGTSTTPITSKELQASDYLNVAPLGNISDDPDVSRLFQSLKFRLRGLSPGTEALTSKEIRSAGGKIVSISDGSTHVDYLVCDQVECGQLRQDGNYDQAVTVFFVKNCLMNCRMVRPSSHPLYRPIPAVENSTVFLNTVIVVSCFSDYERMVLIELIRKFGGRVQETLAKRNKGDQLAVTHVVGGNEGQRVVEARRQKFKVVDPSWVIECVINDKLLKEESFPLRGEAYTSYEGRTDDLWPETARRRSLPRQTSAMDDFSDLIPDELRDQSMVTPDVTRATFMDNELRTVMTSTPLSSVPQRLRTIPDRTLDMKKTFKPQFQGLTQVVENIPSPSTSVTTDESLTETMVGRILKEAAVKTAALKHQNRSDPTPTNSSDKILLAQQAINSSRAITRLSIRKSKPQEGSLISVEKEPVKKALDIATPHTSGMMALRAKMTERLEQRNREIASRLAESKAPTAPASLYYSDEDASLTKRRKRPQSGGHTGPTAKKTSQSPLTPTPTPEETPPPLIEWQPAMPGRLSTSMLGMEEPLDSTRPPVTTTSTGSDSHRQVRASRIISGVARRSSSDERVSSNAANSFGVHQEVAAVPVNDKPSIRVTAAPGVHSAPIQGDNALARRRSGVDAKVNYRSAPQANYRCAPETPLQTEVEGPGHSVNEVADLRQATAKLPAVKQERTSFEFSATNRHFIFTSVVPHEKLRLSNIISRLGGVADSGELNDDCTHLICGKLIRGAKLMGCIASGRWVVGSDYVDKSLAAGKWLPETDYELGDPIRLASMELPERELKLAQACRRWRIKLNNIDPVKRKGAFQGWRCVLYCSEEKAAGLIPMLKIGGADAIVRKQNEGAPRIYRPTHAVLCNSNMWNMEELSALVDIGAKVYQLEYISKYLLEENVDEAACYHSDYKRILQCRR